MPRRWMVKPSAPTSLTMVQNGRLEMAHQTAARFLDRVAYQSFGGIALDESEGERDHDHPHLEKRVPFCEHPLAFPRLESATLGAWRTALSPPH